nr:triple gene block protein 3 [Wheat stripe mosaic virus]QII15650.1 triple gene block protein 3 [Wheat stripe mosaic virus]QII15660.1 triple gene block protein 3 [Wheat stripe mosaic virus]QII15675.1 triple gene block protein 3 [Wheat stripe mosaic virus]QII15680.1 triple gene block protein 3 [Wheat stripe mosaic virus]
MVHVVRFEVAEVVKYFVVGWVLVTAVQSFRDVAIAQANVPEVPVIEGGLYPGATFYADKTKVVGFKGYDVKGVEATLHHLDEVSVKYLTSVVAVCKLLVVIIVITYLWFWWHN